MNYKVTEPLFATCFYLQGSRVSLRNLLKHDISMNHVYGWSPRFVWHLLCICCKHGRSGLNTVKVVAHCNIHRKPVNALRKMWGFHGGDYEECCLLIYRNPVRTSQETHYVSVTGSSQLILCKMWGFHGSDYEQCRILGYKIRVRTSQETHYFSATESSQLMLCKMWDFHGTDYEECHLLEYKNPVRTSQETHFISATEYSQLMLCKM
jgi:hypothetical protein